VSVAAAEAPNSAADTTMIERSTVKSDDAWRAPYALPIVLTSSAVTARAQSDLLGNRAFVSTSERESWNSLMVAANSQGCAFHRTNKY
jgi:hypothetical protein